MKNLFKNISFLFFLLFLVSCQDVIELDVEDGSKRIVIDGRISDRSPNYVEVTTTAPYFDQGPTNRVSNCAVVIYEDGDTAAVLVPDSIPGLYSTSFQGEIGKQYEISVEVFPGNEAFEASVWKSNPETLKRVFSIDSLNIRKLNRNTTPQTFEEGYFALMYFQEPPGLGDNYRIRRWLNDSLFSSEVFTFEDDFFDGRYIGGSGLFAIPAFNLFGPFDEDEKDIFRVEVSSITDDYSSFLGVLAEQVFQVGGPFDPPPQTIIGNIYNLDDPSEFGLGYFSASALDQGQITFSK